MSSTSDFTTMKQLGQGCSGICRLVRRKADQRLYALKELEMPPDPAEANAVLQEVHELGTAPGLPLIEKLDGVMVQGLMVDGRVYLATRSGRSPASSRWVPGCAPRTAARWLARWLVG